jgi:hypothetical protein
VNCLCRLPAFSGWCFKNSIPGSNPGSEAADQVAALQYSPRDRQLFSSLRRRSASCTSSEGPGLRLRVMYSRPATPPPIAIDLSQRNGCLSRSGNRYPCNAEFSITRQANRRVSVLALQTQISAFNTPDEPAAFDAGVGHSLSTKPVGPLCQD